jgi:hypothetical protein
MRALGDRSGGVTTDREGLKEVAVQEENRSIDEVRFGRLHRQLRFCQCGLGLTLGLIGVMALTAMRNSTAQAGMPPDVLRVRGLIIEDAQGRARILLGAPIPKTRDRKRQDDATGMIVLGENGADRVSVGAPTPDPQVTGRGVLKRIAKGAGMQIHDLDGNERGGFTYMDNGRISIGMDYPAREAVSLFLMPEGLAGLLIAGQEGRTWERAGLILNNKTGSVVLKLSDTNSQERAMLSVRGDSAARFLVLDPATKQQRDVLEKLRR